MTQITIRHAEPDDYRAVARIYASPNATAGTLQVPYPSAEMWKKRLADTPATDRVLLAVVGDEVVGNLGLQSFAQRRRAHAAHIGMAVRDDWAGKGVGTALMHAAVDLADNWLNLLRLELTVFSDNAVAQKLYRKFGFEVEGLHRSYGLRHGRYEDVLAMARLHPQAPQIGGRQAPFQSNLP